MKKDRNCAAGTPTPYPMPVGQMGYPIQGGPMMAGPVPMGQPGMYPMNPVPMGTMPMNTSMGNPNMTNITTTPSCSGNDGINANQAVTAIEQLQAQINNLDRRVSRIESMMQDTKSGSFTSNKFTDSNYHMM